MSQQLPNLNLSNPFNDLFSTEEDRTQEKVIKLHCSEIDSFVDHPYKVKDNEDMRELTESIRENGVMLPCIVRPKADGRYEMISGHRRKHAAMLAGIDEIPVIVRNLDDNQATILMVDSNAHRPVILPSEKAFAYKMRLEAMNRQGQRTDLTSAPVEPKLRSNEELASQSPDSRAQIQRYIRLTNLIPPLLQLVDNSVEKPERGALQMALRPAVELSYLTQENQYMVYEFIGSSETTPSHAQAIQLRNLQKSGALSSQDILSILTEEKPNQKEHISISIDKISRYFPRGAKRSDIEKTIIDALDYYQNSKVQNKSTKIIK